VGAGASTQRWPLHSDKGLESTFASLLTDPSRSPIGAELWGASSRPPDFSPHCALELLLSFLAQVGPPRLLIADMGEAVYIAPGTDHPIRLVEGDHR
jgi:hypothetical protein